MARGMPSLAALLGLLAVAGYQNRDKIGEFIKGMTGPGGAALPGGDPASRTAGGQDNSILGGLGELVDQFRRGGQGETADSWVSKGPNRPIDDGQLSNALGDDLIDRLVQQTGLSRQELLSRLSKVLPEAVDRMTPDGRLPA